MDLLLKVVPFVRALRLWSVERVRWSAGGDGTVAFGRDVERMDPDRRALGV